MIWVKCDMCDEWLCRIHGEHVADCPCPSLDVWVEADRDPYLDECNDEVTKWVSENECDS